MASINKGDNTGAFGNEFLRIYVNNPNNMYIQKAVVHINGNLEKEYYEPKFPLTVNFTGAETEMLTQVNHCKLALWDEYGRRRTAEGKFTFFVKENCIKHPDEPTYMEPQNEPNNTMSFDLTDPEFAAQFVINTSPEKLSELEIDVPLLTFDNIIGGENVDVDVVDNKIIISAEVDAHIDWSEINNKPTINGKPLEGNVSIENNANWDSIEGKPNFADVAFSGDYTDLTGCPTIPTKVSQLFNDKGYINNLDDYYKKSEVDALIPNTSELDQKLIDLENTQTEDKQELQTQITENKIALQGELDNKADYSYVDETLSNVSKLIGKGNFNVNVNGNTTTFPANTHYDINLDIDIPTNLSQLNNDTEFVKKEEIDLSAFITREEAENLAVKEDIGTGIITIKQNNNTIGSFNVNTNTNKVLEFNTPQNISELNNDSLYITEDNVQDIRQDIIEIEEQLTAIPEQFNTLQQEVDNKVNIQPGKDLFSVAEAQRLANVDNYNDEELRGLIQDNTSSIILIKENVDNKVDKDGDKVLSQNDFTNDDKNNLDYLTQLTPEIDSNVHKLQNRILDSETNIGNNTTKIAGLQESLDNEALQRQDTDNYLQQQIEAMTAKSNVVDILATYEDLENYDLSGLYAGDVICVIKDAQHNETTTYYRYDGNTFLFIGSEGEYFTKSDTNALFVRKTTLVNGHALNSDITLTYNDVNALPNDTVIGDGTVTVQRNGVNIGEFTLNQVDNKHIDIIVPEKISEIENDINLINEDFLFTYLGDVPADNNVQDQLDVIVLEQQSTDRKIATLQDLITGGLGGLPEVALTGSYNDLTDKPTIPSKTSQLENDAGYITLAEAQEGYLTEEDLPTKLSQLENDRGYVTNNSIGRGVLTLSINGTAIGEFMANERENINVEIPVETALDENSLFPISNQAVTKMINQKDAESVHLSGDQTIDGIKTFKNVILENGQATTLENEDNSKNIATTEFVKNQDYCTNTDAVHKTGDETITGIKSFDNVVLNNAVGVTMEASDDSKALATTEYVKNQDYATNSEAVHKQGNETIQGDKTFNDTVTLGGIVNLSKYSHVPTPVEDDEALDFTDLVTNVEFVNNKIDEVNTRIDSEVASLNGDIQSQVIVLNQTINNKESALSQSITNLTTTVNNNKTELDGKISNVYTKTEIDNKLTSINNDIDNIYTKSEIDGQIDTVNSTFDTKLTNYYNKTELYTKTEVDNLLKQKQDQIDSLTSLIQALTARVDALENPTA